MTRQFSRRDFLKAGGSALAATLTPSWRALSPGVEEWLPPSDKVGKPFLARMGRVTAAGTTVYAEPKPRAERVGYYRRDESFIITGEVL